MITTAKFADLLRNTFLNPDNAARNQKEIEISDFINTHPEDYCTLTADIFRSPNIDANARMFAITTFNQAYRLRRNDHSHPTWAHLPLPIRQSLKTAAFNLLVDPQVQLHKPGANSLAQIYMLDLTSPKPVFGDILNSVCSNVAHANLDFAGIAVTALASICDLMSPQKLQLLNETERDLLLGGICNAMKNQDQNALSILHAATSAMPLMAPKFAESREFLQFILEHILTFLQYGKQSQNPELIQESINCLGQVVKYEYFQMSTFIQIVIQNVIEFEKSGEPSVRRAACEFFIKCFKYERQSRTGYFDSHWQSMTDNALRSLAETIRLDEGSNEEVLDHLENYSRILNHLNILYSELTFPILGRLVSENLQSNNEIYQVYAVMILESMVDVKANDQALSSFREVFTSTFELIASAKSQLLRVVAINCTERILSEFIILAFEGNNLSRLIDINLQCVLNPDESGLAEQVKLLALNALDQISVKSKDIRKFLVQLHLHLEQIMTAIFRIAGSTSFPTLIDAVFATMFSYIENVMDSIQHNYYFPTLFGILEAYKSMPTDPNRQMYLDSIVINLNLILTKLMMNNEVIFPGTPDRGQRLQHILLTVASIYEENPTSSTECLTLMTTVIASNRDFFQNALIEFFDRFLKPGLSNKDDVTQAQAAILSFITLIKTYPTELAQSTHDFLQYIFVIIETDIARELRTAIYYFLSDVMIQSPHQTRDFAEAIMNMNLNSLQIIMTIMNTDRWDDDSLKFAGDLRDLVIENFFCYIHGLFPMNDSNIFRLFEERLPAIQEALKTLSMETNNPTPEFRKQVVNLLIDCLARLKNRSLIDSTFIIHIFQTIDQRDPEYKEIKDRLEALRVTG